MSQLDPRSLLFVPGSRPERFDKAIAAGADLVCIDLEDAVGPDQKVEARATLCKFLASQHDNVGVRLNALNTPLGVADVAALLESNARPAFIMLPKVEDAATVGWASDLFEPSIHIVPIVETAKGLASADAISAMARVQCVLFGAVDYSADVGCGLDWDSLYYARMQLIHAAVAGDAVLFDVPWIDVSDTDGLFAEVRRTRALGLPARAAIHPTQIDVIHDALAPSDDELAQAKRVVAAFEAADGGAALLDGKMIELPVIKSARRVIARARS